MWGIKLIFCLEINTKIFYELMVSRWVYAAFHSQSTQNSKFAMSLQYLKENVKNEIDFLPGGTHQSFFLIDTII